MRLTHLQGRPYPRTLLCSRLQPTQSSTRLNSPWRLMTSEEEDDGDIDAEDFDEIIDLPHGLKMARRGNCKSLYPYQGSKYTADMNVASFSPSRQSAASKPQPGPSEPMLPSQPETTEGGDQPAATDSGNQPATTESGKPLFPEDPIAHLSTLVPDTLDNIIDITALGGSSLNGHHPNSYYTENMFSFAFPIITPKGPGRVRLPLTTIQSIEQMSEGAGLFSCAVTHWNQGVKTTSAFHILIKSFHVSDGSRFPISSAR
jgi:hypothetical protein